MRMGYFNIQEYIKKLNENTNEEDTSKVGKEGIIIPEENKKVFSWLKREYDKNKVEVKVEIKVGDNKFEPGYNLQTNLKSVNDFKPGMYGEIKTSDILDNKKEESKDKKELKKSEINTISAKVKKVNIKEK